jgi:very-short-patch-repair endonuclease
MYRDLARHLRKNMTDAERRLWWELRHRQMAGCKFRRQAPVGPYIADFVCFEERLIIELDGGQHAERSEEDATRTGWFVEQGFAVLRFWNHQVLEELDGVLEAIWLMVGSTPHPNPPPQGGRG